MTRRITIRSGAVPRKVTPPASAAVLAIEPTFLVAASDARADLKIVADYVCDGTADEVEINAAIAALPAIGGRISLSEGTFSLAASININVDADVALVGVGTGTQLNAAAGFGANPMILTDSTFRNQTHITSLHLNGDQQTNGSVIGIKRINEAGLWVFFCEILSMATGIHSVNSSGGFDHSLIYGNRIDICNTQGVLLQADSRDRMRIMGNIFAACAIGIKQTTGQKTVVFGNSWKDSSSEGVTSGNAIEAGSNTLIAVANDYDGLSSTGSGLASSHDDNEPDHTHLLRIDGTRAMTGNLVMGVNKVTGVVDPTSDQDAATKAYVDAGDAGDAGAAFSELMLMGA